MPNDVPMKRKSIILTLSSILLVIAVAAVLFSARREAYFLNKTVRLVSFRVSQFEWLSFVQQKDYKILFHPDRYVISFLERGEWNKFAVHRYPGHMVCTADRFELFLHRGSVAGKKIGNKVIEDKANAVIQFHPKNKPDRRKGIIFQKKGKWHVLG